VLEDIRNAIALLGLIWLSVLIPLLLWAFFPPRWWAKKADGLLQRWDGDKRLNARLFRPVVQQLFGGLIASEAQKAEKRREERQRRRELAEAARREEDEKRKRSEEWALANERYWARQRASALETLTSSRDPHQLADAVRTLGTDSPEVVAALLARGVRQ